MPNIRTSKQYKKKKIEEKYIKRLSRKDKWNKTQKQFKRSRLSKFQNVIVTDEIIKEHRNQLNRIRVHRSRAVQRNDQAYEKNVAKR